MADLRKSSFNENLDKYQVLIQDTDANSKYFKITQLPDAFTGGKNAFLIAGSEYLVPDTLIKIEIKDAKGNIIYSEPGEGMISSSFNGESFVAEYYEGTSKVVAVYVYPDTAYGPCTITILGELGSYDNNGTNIPTPPEWQGTYNVKWQRQINVNPSLANTTKIRFYRRPQATITEILSPIYRIESGSKVASGVNQSFANIKLSQLETFAGDVKRVKVFRTSQGDISDYDLIQDILVESKELLTSYGLSGSVVGLTGILTQETLPKYWNTGSLKAELTSSRVESGVKLSGSGYFTYTSSLDIKAANTYELNLDAFYSSSTASNLGVYLSYVSQSTTFTSSIATLQGIVPTKNLLDTTIPFKLDNDYPTASLYFSQSQGEWHLGNISLKLSQDTAFSPDEISFVTTMPTVIGNETYNFKFEFYDVNNNYVPVAVTQSALFNGGNNNIGGTLTLISSSASSSLSNLYAVSSSISGTMTVYSSSASGSVGALSGSVSSSLSSLSSSVSASNVYILSSSLSKTQQLADGKYSGSFIGDTVVYSPTIGGQQGYISSLFKVGTTPSIYLDARQNPRKIFIGGAIPSGQTEYSGAYNNTNTNVYLDSAGKFSLGNKLSWNGTDTLTISGQINIEAGGNAATKNDASNAAASASISSSLLQTQLTNIGLASGSWVNPTSYKFGGNGFTLASVTPSGTGLHFGSDYMGYYTNGTWKTYMNNSGQFYLAGNGNNGLSWNGNDLSIDGTITARGGYIGDGTNGFLISSTSIKNGTKTSYASTGTGVYVGTDGIGLGTEFSVSAGGVLTATSATIIGAITATSITATTAGNIAGWGISNTILGTTRLKLNSLRPAMEIYDTGGSIVVDISTANSLSDKSAGSITPSPSSLASSGDRVSIFQNQSYDSRYSYFASFFDDTIHLGPTTSTFTLAAGNPLIGRLCSISSVVQGMNTLRFDCAGDDYYSTTYIVNQSLACRVGFQITAPDGSKSYAFTTNTSQDSSTHINTVTLYLTPTGTVSTSLILQQGTYTITPYISNLEALATLSNSTGNPSVFQFDAFTPYISLITAQVPVSKTEMIAGGFQVVYDTARYISIPRANNADFVSIGGGLTCTGDVTANTSDRRLKENIRIIDNPLEKIENIRGVYFNYTDDAKLKTGYTNNEEQVGFIAQEVQEVLPHIVKPAPFDKNQSTGESISGENYLTIQYEKIVPLLLEGIKELKKEIEELKKNR